MLIVLILFFVYAGSALLLCILGAQSYAQTAGVLQENFDQRTGVMYIAQKVRQNDSSGSIRLDTYKGTDALVLVEQETGLGYETWIFVKEGYLCEELIAPGAGIVDDQAQRIMPLQEMRLSFAADNLLNVSLTAATEVVNSTNLALRSAEVDGGGAR